MLNRYIGKFLRRPSELTDLAHDNDFCSLGDKKKSDYHFDMVSFKSLSTSRNPLDLYWLLLLFSISISFRLGSDTFKSWLNG